MENRKLRVGITHGDINGIGYEVLMKTLEDPRIAEMCTPIVYGSAKIAAFYRKAGAVPEVKFTTVADPSETDPAQDRNYMINVVPEDTPVAPGEESKAAGAAALASLEAATAHLKEGKIDVLVTCPISKSAIHGDNFSFPGHTEYLAAKAGEGARPVMIMASPRLRVALVTIHEPISDVAGKITREGVLDTIKALSHSLVSDFGIHSPRIAVLGLNPHAGDSGVLGNEETEIIAPAVAEAARQKILAFGPYPADGFFAGGGYTKFDGVVAMYHDQGLIPFKLLAGEDGVNYTAGLPFVRTSPDHGTAFDIAGKGVADPQSLRSALYMAIDIYNNRLREAEATANPLKKQHFDRGSKDN